LADDRWTARCQSADEDKRAREPTNERSKKMTRIYPVALQAGSRKEPEKRHSYLSRQERAQREEGLREPGFRWANHIGLRSRPGFLTSKPIKRAARETS
jgi:hypothetical protein